MKRLNVLLISVLFSTALWAQSDTVNTGILQIQIDTKIMSGLCNLASADTVYMHSGLGWSNPDSIWETIVGDWGLDDGKGQMTETAAGSGIWSICFNVRDYYTYEADPDSTHVGGVGDGPMSPSGTPYNIGVVFRNSYCPYDASTKILQCTESQVGKDENCENIYIIGINNPATMIVTDNDGKAFKPLTVKYITQCTGLYATLGVEDLNPSFASVNIFPLPFNDALNIQFRYLNGLRPTVEVFNLVGEKVADLSSRVSSGSNTIIWNGKTAAGANVASGFYMVKISNGQQTYTAKVIKD